MDRTGSSRRKTLHRKSGCLLVCNRCVGDDDGRCALQRNELQCRGEGRRCRIAQVYIPVTFVVVLVVIFGSRGWYLSPFLFHVAPMMRSYMVRALCRPGIPASCPASLAELVAQCWHADPSRRPPFEDIIPTLDRIHSELAAPAAAAAGGLR